MAKKIISPNKFSKKFFNKDIFFILNLDKRINKLIFITIFLSVISGVSDIFLVSILSEIIIYTTSGEFTSELSQKLISSIPIGLMIILISYFLRIIVISFNAYVSSYISSKNYYKITKLLEHNFAGSLDQFTLNSLTELTSSSRLFSRGYILPFLSMIASAITGLIIVIGLSIFVGGYFLVSSLILFSFYILLSLITKKLVNNISKSLNFNLSSLDKLINHLALGWKNIYSEKKQYNFLKRIKTNFWQYEKSVSDIDVIASSPRVLTELFVAILLFWFFIKSAQSSNILLDFLFVLVGALRIIPLFQKVFSSYSKLSANLHIIGKVKKLNQNLNYSINNFSSTKYIWKNNLNFPFYIKVNSDTTLPFLKNIKLRILKNSITFLKGPSGSGKTSLLDGISNIREIKGLEIHSSIKNKDLIVSYLPQNPFIGEITLNDFFGQTISQKYFNELVNSLDAQFIYEINWTKKINFDTSFSGGQIKRIALIKTILKKANIYLLDEPFSDLPQVLGLNFLKFFKESNINAPLLISVHSSYYDNLATNIKILEA